MELDRKELYTKFDEANQTIRALRFEKNFLVEKTKKIGRASCRERVLMSV